jgi:hypothetical protein
MPSNINEAGAITKNLRTSNIERPTSNFESDNGCRLFVSSSPGMMCQVVMPIQRSPFVILDWIQDPFFRAKGVIRNLMSGDKKWIPDLHCI